MTNSGVDLVLFDLGGELIEMGDVSSLPEVAAVVGNEEQWHQWLASPWVRRFEMGECSASEFFYRSCLRVGSRSSVGAILGDLP